MIKKEKEEELEIVKRDGLIIRWIENPPEEVQLAAVNQNGWSIEHIKNPTIEVQNAAVNQNINTLQFTTQEFKEFYPEYFL